MQGNFTKDEEKFSLFLPLPKPYVVGKNKLKERDLGNKKCMPKTHKLSFLEQHDQVPLSEKENELLDRDFGYKNIDELVVDFNNTKTDEESDKLFNNIANKLTLLKKLIQCLILLRKKE